MEKERDFFKIILYTLISLTNYSSDYCVIDYYACYSLLSPELERERERGGGLEKERARIRVE